MRRLSKITGWGLVVALAAISVRADESVRPPLPPITVDLNVSAYPVSAQKDHVQGRVLVAFNITKRGRVDKENVVDAEPAGVFDDAALDAVKRVQFTVPTNWVDKAGPLQRYRLSILFKLQPCPPDTCTAPKPHADADDFVIIGALAK